MRYAKPLALFVSVLAVLSFSFFVFTCESSGLELKSSAFADGEAIPDRYTSLGENISPVLSWDGAREGTKSFVLIMDDPDAPMGTWVHWVVFNIPGDSAGLEENIPKKHVLGDGTRQGLNSFRWVGYGGPSPPPGPAHRYIFNLYALDTVLDLPPGSNEGEVARAMQGHILGTARLTGLFAR